MNATVDRYVRTHDHDQSAYYQVICRPCLAALNSGHQYSEESKHHAYALAAEHNAAEHADTTPPESGYPDSLTTR